MFKNILHKHKVKQIEILSDLPDIDREPRYKVKVIGNSLVTKDSFVLSLDRPDGFIFTPGQYTWIVVPELSKEKGIIDRRAYSIYSGSDNSILQFLILKSDSEYLSKLKSLKVGDEVEIIGPMGSSFTVPLVGVVMIAGGTGIAPFLSILRSKKMNNITLIEFSSKGNSLHNKEGLDELSKKYNYEFIYKEGRPRPMDFRGIIHRDDKRPILLAGSPDFINFITKMLIKLGIAKQRLTYEQNYPNLKPYKKLESILVDMLNSESPSDIRKLSELGDLFFQVSKQTSNHVVLTDSNGKILFANNAANDMTGYSFDEMKGQTPRLWGGLMPSQYYKNMWTYLKEGTAVKHTVLNRRRNGELYTSIATITPILRKTDVIMFVSTEEDVTALRNVDKAKSEFVSFASHQLRAPLSTVNWYTEMLLGGDAGKVPKEQRNYIKEIRVAGQHMAELIRSLLDISRIEAGSFSIEPVQANMEIIVKEVIDEQKNEILRKKTSISLSPIKNIPIIYGDPKLLHMIVQNLLSNAIKYTPEKGDVKLELLPYGSKNILLKVSDNGYGIPKNQQAKIFTKLFRADNVSSMSTEGTGLGLYIIKSIVNKTGGKIWFESEENKGSTFYVSIPIKTKIEK